MFIRSTTKKIIWVIFALGGLGLGIGLTASGIFAPFGVSVLGAVGAGLLLSLAMLAVAVLLIMAMKLISKTINRKINIPPSEDSLTTIFNSENSLHNTTQLPEKKTVQQLSKEQLKSHAEQVKDYLVNQFQVRGALFMNIFIGNRTSENLPTLANNNINVVETENNNYRIVFYNPDFFVRLRFFLPKRLARRFLIAPPKKLLFQMR